MAEDKGSWSERWQMRQEMVAHGIQVGWRLPTREDFAHFNDARNLKDDMDTALPWEVTRISLPQMMQSIDYVTPDEQARIHDLTMKEDRTQPERLELIALWSKVAPVVEVVREEVQAFNRGYHLWNPVNLTDAQVQALEDYAAAHQQEMFQPNQLAFDDRPAAITFARQVSVIADDQERSPYTTTLPSQEDATAFRQALTRMAEQTKPHAYIAAEAARLRVEQRSAEVVKEVAKKDHSIGF